jgi:hypothetical protein
LALQTQDPVAGRGSGRAHARIAVAVSTSEITIRPAGSIVSRALPFLFSAVPAASAASPPCPEGFAQIMSKRDLRDLVEWLASLKDEQRRNLTLAAHQAAVYRVVGRLRVTRTVLGVAIARHDPLAA